jgi:hypothetical protein
LNVDDNQQQINGEIEAKTITSGSGKASVVLLSKEEFKKAQKP